MLPATRRTWKTLLPVTFIILSLLALVALPLVVSHRTSLMREEIASVAEPSRRDANLIQLALARELDELIAFQVTEQTQYRQHFESVLVEQQQAATRIAARSSRLQIKPELDRLREAADGWHRTVRQRELLSRHLPPDIFALVLFENHPNYEKALAAAAELERAIQVSIEERLQSIRNAERWNRNLTTILTLLALTSAILVIRLGRQMRRLAIEAEGRRRDAQRDAREAQQAVQAREQVLAIVSHDLRNPLSAITLSSSLLASGDLEQPELQEQFDVIRLSAGRMNRLIEDLLDVSRMEGGKALPIDPKVIDVGPLLAEVAELFKPQTAAAEVSLTVEPPGGIPNIKADRDRIIQVLSNLVGNAMKFTPARGTIELGAISDSDFVRVFVRDSGPGIPAEDQADIFDPYWQGKKTERLGAGLGLPIARGIVESHGGRIWVESQPGKGTTFSFTVPVAM